MRPGLVRVTATFYPNYYQWSSQYKLSKSLLKWKTYNLSKYNSLQTFLLLSFENAAAGVAVIGCLQQILTSDWLFYCALALLAAHSKTNVSHSDTPGKLTLWGPEEEQNHNKVSSLPSQASPDLSQVSCVLRNQQESSQIWPQLVRTWVSISCRKTPLSSVM